MKLFFVLLAFCLMCTSCSTIEFNTSGREVFQISARSGSERIIEVETTKDFYFWGMVPASQELDLWDETHKEGISNPSYVSIEQRYRIRDILFTFATLGIYCPSTYRVQLLSLGENK